ncbi:MAG: leucine--tRNA ligase [Bacteroidetes bacterium]|nr:leucine--tRNA ligase [Bacteroidota bacterium]
MAYPFQEIEKKWQKYWAEKKTFRAENKSGKEKYYALDMFPYPSGAGLHVGHPLGYIASDIVSRYKRLKGFNVLHPMGYDSFGLPAEQYAIQTGQHPAITTENNIARYREQMDKIGFSFDWEREVRTSDPNYYKWTQWIFLKLFNSWYNPETNKAEPIETLIPKLKNYSSLSEKEKSDLMMNYRLAYLSEAWVNWCPQLGTVLANEEVKDGVSERGGYPVERKLMPQWSLRITAYAERLLNDLEKIDWSESIKESQRNWIGKSEGSSLKFQVSGFKFQIEVFTTRPDTIFGVTFLTLAPESDLVPQLTTPEQKQKVEVYVHYAKNRSERERQTEVKKVTGEFTGSYCIHPFTGEKLPIWIGEYVLAGYGTGAVMGVPAHDTRDFAFAKHFGLEIKKVIAPNDKSLQKEECFDTYDGYAINSDFINGLQVKDAIKKIISEIEKRNLGKGKTQYRLRDAIFGRQRYWGEPIPIYYKEGIPCSVDEKDLPVILPEVDKYLPTETGEPPLARAKNWKYKNSFEFEKTTMPGWAGSSWYYLRYMDSQNKNEFASRDALNYWRDVDLYIGGSEHATGHLLYVRFWTKFLFDLGFLPIVEPAKKLINQGMILGRSNFVYRINYTLGSINAYDDTLKEVEAWKKAEDQLPFIYVTKSYFERYLSGLYTKKKIVDDINNVLRRKKINTENFVVDFNNQNKLIDSWRTDINAVNNDELDLDKFIIGVEKEAEFIREDDGKYICGFEVEKMSKSFKNVVTPDFICNDFGADTLRMYEMFLGPLEMSKPWNTNGISGVFNFLNRFWRLFHKENPTKNPEEKIQNPEFYSVSDDEPTKEELKILHKTIKKIQEDIENYSFNTAVSAFMICTNELTELKCSKRKILEPLVILLLPFAPHIAEELWNKLGHKESVTFASFPQYNDALTIDDSFAYPVSFNGKMRFNIELSLSLSPAEIEKEVLALEQTKKYLEGKQPKKIIVVPKRIVNIVV